MPCGNGNTLSILGDKPKKEGTEYKSDYIHVVVFGRYEEILVDCYLSSAEFQIFLKRLLNGDVL